MGRFSQRISAFISARHKAIVLLFSLLALLSLVSILTMEIKTDIIDVLPRGNRTVDQFKDFLQNFGALDNLIIAVQSESKTIDGEIGLIEDLVKNLQGSPMIAYVDYSPFLLKTDFFIKNFPFFLDEGGLHKIYERLSPEGIERQIALNRQQLISLFSSPLDYESIAKDPLNVGEVLWESYRRSHLTTSLDLSYGYYFTSDHTMALIFAKPQGKSRDMSFVKQLAKELESITSSSLKKADNPSGIRIGFTGSYAASEEVRKVIRHDIISSFVISVVLIALLIRLAYRVQGAVLLMIGFTSLSSLAMTLAFAHRVFGSLNIVTSIVASVLIGLYVDYSIHMVQRFSDELRTGKTPGIALDIVISRTGRAILVSALTTSVSFFSIMVTRFEGLYELGIVSGIGILLCLLSNLFLLGSMLIWATKNGSQLLRAGKGISSGMDKLAHLIVTNPKYVTLFSVVLILLACIGITKLSFDNDTERIGIRESPIMALSKEINRKVGKRGDPLSIVIKGRDREGLAAEFDSLERALAQWKRERIIESYESLGTFLPAPSAQQLTIKRLKELNKDHALHQESMEKRLENAHEKNSLACDRDYIRSYLAGILNALRNYEGIRLEKVETLSDPKINRFYNKEALSIAAYLYPPSADWNEESLKRIRSYIGSPGSGRSLTGKHILFHEIRSSILSSSLLASVLCLIMNLIIIYWFFRDQYQVLAVMLPLLGVISGVILTLGMMGYLREPFNFINIGTIALIFGFGVDYGIYLMHAYLREEVRDTSNALRITGKNILMCAATTIAGCGSLVTVKFAGIASIGIVLSLGALSCAFTSLVLLPAILQLLEKKPAPQKQDAGHA